MSLRYGGGHFLTQGKLENLFINSVFSDFADKHLFVIFFQ
jgi:hypothetical protein